MNLPFPILAFFGIGDTEILLIMVVVLIFFGGKKMPEFARGLGKALKELKKASGEVEREFKRVLDEAEHPILPPIKLPEGIESLTQDPATWIAPDSPVPEASLAALPPPPPIPEAPKFIAPAPEAAPPLSIPPRNQGPEYHADM